MENNFIPQMKPWFDEREKEALSEYMDSGGWITEFNKTAEFAKMIVDYTGARYCSILSNGTVTMTAALIAMGITDKADEVIVPDYTMIATPNSVIMAGATPVFCDVERESMGMNFERMKAVVTEKTKAIILVSINGRYSSGVDQILSFCKNRNIRVIEDAAQSLGSFHKERHVGRYGDVASFSFSMPKIITTGQGGALITDNEELFNKIELVRNFGRAQAGVDKHISFGVNFKFTDLQAVLGIEQMKKISLRVDFKKKQYEFLQQELNAVEAVEFIQTSSDTTPWFNDILVDKPLELQSFLKSKGIGSRPFYPSVHTQAPFHQTGSYPNADYLSSHGLWLPSYSQLSDDELNRIVAAIKVHYS